MRTAYGRAHIVLELCMGVMSSAGAPQPFEPYVLMMKGVETTIGLILLWRPPLGHAILVYDCMLFIFTTLLLFPLCIFGFVDLVIDVFVLCVFCDQYYRFVCAQFWNKKGWSCHAARWGGQSLSSPQGLTVSLYVFDQLKREIAIW